LGETPPFKRAKKRALLGGPRVLAQGGEISGEHRNFGARRKFLLKPPLWGKKFLGGYDPGCWKKKRRLREKRPEVKESPYTKGEIPHPGITRAEGP